MKILSLIAVGVFAALSEPPTADASQPNVPTVAAASQDMTAIWVVPASSEPPDPQPAMRIADPGYLDRYAVQAWMHEVARRGDVAPVLLERVLRDARNLPQVVQLIAPPPVDRPRTWKGYRARFVEPIRIAGGLRFWDEHAAALARASARWGVPPEVVVAIAGVETVYGRVQGNFRVADALATLGFDWPAGLPRDRSAFFRDQLAELVAYAGEHHAEAIDWVGSYAGAIGIPQFMPGSIRRYGVDFDGDGIVDLRNSPADAIGSIANFLAAHGWQRDLPITVGARVRTADAEPLIAHDLTVHHTLAELHAAGVDCRAAQHPGRLKTNPQFGLVDLTSPDAPTEYRCATANFFAITQYNRTFFYAAAVTDLAATLRAKREARARQRR